MANASLRFLLDRAGPWIAGRALAAAVILLFIGPFADRSQLLSDALDRSASPLNQRYAAPAQDAIAVILFEDADLEELGTSWPVPYDLWARVLGTLACARPKVVFFDILFGREQAFKTERGAAGPSMAEVDAAVLGNRQTEKEYCPPGPEAVDARAAKVFYAYADRPEDWLPELDQHRKLPIKWTGAAGDYPLTIGTQYAAAYRLMKAYCEASAGASRLAGCSATFSEEHLRGHLLPRWSMRAPAYQALFSEQTCPDESDRSFLAAVGTYLRNMADAPATPCLPFLTIGASQLLTQADAQMFGLLRDRVVLVGVNLTGAGDQVETQTHGQVPGVFLHATALENLLAMGARYDRIQARPVVTATIVFILLVSSLHFLFDHLLSARQGRSGSTGVMVEYVLPMAGMLTVFASIALVMRQVLRFPPGLVPFAAFTMTLGLLLGELSQEGRVHQWIRRLFRAE